MGRVMDKLSFKVTFISDREPEIIEYYIPLLRVAERESDPVKKIVEMHNVIHKKAREDAITKFGDDVKEVTNIAKQQLD